MLTEKLSSSTEDLFTSKLLGGIRSLLVGDLKTVYVSNSWTDESTLFNINIVGYVSAGDMFYNDNRVNDPVRLYDVARCMRHDLAVDCSWGNRIWTDDGSTALYDVSVWGLTHAEGALFTDFLFAHSEHSHPPSLNPKCITESAIMKLYSI